MLLKTLAVWRLTYLLVNEEGPGGALTTLQEISRQHGGPLDCFWCASVWIAGLFALRGRNKLVRWLALSAGAIWLDEFRKLLQKYSEVRL